MRTTIDIEEDILLAAKELARHEKSTAGKVISRLAREALTGNVVKSRQIRYRNGVPILQSRGRVITNELINKIREEEGI